MIFRRQPRPPLPPVYPPLSSVYARPPRRYAPPRRRRRGPHLYAGMTLHGPTAGINWVRRPRILRRPRLFRGFWPFW